MALVVGSPHAASVNRVAQLDDAFVEFDAAAGRWSIGNSRIRYTIGVSRQRAFFADSLTVDGRDDTMLLETAPDTLVTVDGDAVRLGAPGSGFVVDGVDPAEGTHFVSMSVRLSSRDHGVIAVRHYVLYPQVAAVEMWTDFLSADGEEHRIANLNAFALTVPYGDVEWLAGLDTPDADGGSFSRQRRALAPGERSQFGSPTLSSETAVPYVSVGNGHRRFFSGLVWSGAWTTRLERSEDQLRITMGLPAMTAIVRHERQVEGPHAFIGAVYDVPGADTAAVTRFVYAGRAGRRLPAPTAFNTWFVYGINIDEQIVRRDIYTASQIGIELFQVDAGWYPRVRPEHTFDFVDGLGSWEVDRARFPSGLAAIGDYARGLGVQLGVWVEPERVALSTVGRPGLAQERFLAQQHGAYTPGIPNDEARDGQVCLADRQARAWVLERLTQFIDQVRPDNLKWDFNRWVHCTRADHDHPPDGGNYEHTRGLYELLAVLRERYPNMTIENCAQGAHRIDFALARLTDAAWMDDRSAPSSHVRRNFQGLSWIFPASYLFSYVLSHPDDPIQGSGDIPLLSRSRMPGMMGLATEFSGLSEGEINQLHQQIELAKGLRAMQTGAVTHVLTPQGVGYGAWEVVQQHNAATGISVVFAYSNGAGSPIRISLRGIQPGTVYELRSADRGRMRQISGVELIAGGLEIQEAAESGAQVLILEPVTGPARTP